MKTESRPVTASAIGISEDAFRRLIGDGKAAVEVGMSYGAKDYGNGFEARVSVTLTCDQSAAGVEQATARATDLAMEALILAKNANEAVYEQLQSES